MGYINSDANKPITLEYSMTREESLKSLSSLILGNDLDHPVRVAIDGVDCSGKTTLADQLVDPLEQSGAEVIRASIDGFHNPLEIRTKRGSLSPIGYFEDSFNLGFLIDFLLNPLGPGGNLRYKPLCFNYKTDNKVLVGDYTAGQNAILLFDGVFLQKPELRNYWDVVIYVDANFDITLARALIRDAEYFGSREATEERYVKRYIPGQKLYIEQCLPAEKADILFVNNDFESPEIIVQSRANII